MKQLALFVVSVFMLQAQPACGQRPGLGQYPPFTQWHQNPLGISPLSLHTSNGILLPAIAAAGILLLTKKDSSMVRNVSYFSSAGASYGYYASRSTVYQSHTGLQWEVRPYMALGAELSVVKVADDINNTWGAGLSPFVKFYPWRGDSFKLFLQSGAGLMLFADTFPKPSGFFCDYREGTRLNGSPKYGGGVEVALGKKLWAQAGIWHVHYSNGDHPGDHRNPGHDSNGFTVGLLYRPL